MSICKMSILKLTNLGSGISYCVASSKTLNISCNLISCLICEMKARTGPLVKVTLHVQPALS